jgi:hypothetical protein
MIVHSRIKRKSIKYKSIKKKSIKYKSIKKRKSIKHKTYRKKRKSVKKYDGNGNKTIILNPTDLNITETTTNLLSLIKINNCEKYESITNETNIFLNNFYKRFVDSEKFIKTLEIKEEVLSQLPENNDFNSIIDNIKNIILKKFLKTYKYTFFAFKKSINVYFALFKDETILYDQEIEIRNNLYKILLWLHVIDNYYEDKTCSQELDIFIYLTESLKILPDKKHDHIKKEHVNTGFTYTCLPKNSIVIYRKEEWYKVFIHETFHNLKLDFSNMTNNNTRNYINNLFKVKSDVKLYEAYTDSWAKIINVLICSYFMCFKNNDSFIESFIENINLERTFCMFQSIKILDHMGLKFEDLYIEDTKIKNKYKEQTSVLSYYIINAIILNSYQEFILWCSKNNKNILQFNHISENQIEFCKFIENNCKTASMLYRIECVTDMYNYYKINNENKYLLYNMRKSLFQLN